MYNNRQPGVYAITGEMCYENKIMMSSAPSIGPTSELDRLAADRQQPAFNEKGGPCKPNLSWAVNVFVIVVVGVLLALIEFDVIPPIKLGYHCQDPSISYPFRGDTITAVCLLTVSMLGPLLVLVPVEFRSVHRKQSVRVIWFWYRQMLIGLITSLMVTEIMKVLIGEPRPHFITTCQPNTEENCEKGTFIRDYTCTGGQYGIYIVGDSHRSFPSGHTTISVFSSVFCVAFLHYRLPCKKLGQLLKPFIMLILLSWGALCGLTRITDRRHHWWDVLAGAIIGVIGVLYTIIVLVRRFTVPEKASKSPV